MKSSKKMLAFLLCAVMVLCMMVTVGVSADEAATQTEPQGKEIFRFAPESLAELVALHGKNGQTVGSSYVKDGAAVAENVSVDFVDDGNGGKAYQLTFKKNINGTVFQKTGLTFTEGNKYVWKYRIKGKANSETAIKENSFFRPAVMFSTSGASDLQIVAAESKSVILYAGKNTVPASDTEWTEYTYEFTIKDIQWAGYKTSTHPKGEDAGRTATKQIRVSTFNTSENDVLAIDYMSLTEYEAHKFTVNVGEGGKVIHSGMEVADGEVINGLYGRDTELEIICNDPSKSPRVTVGDKKVAVIDGKVSIGVEDAGKVINVTFDSDETLYENYFETDEDFTANRKFGAYSTATYAPVTEENGNQAVEFTMTTTTPESASGTTTRVVNLPSNFTWDEGYTYTISYRAKVSESKFDTIGGHMQVLLAKPVSWNTAQNSYPSNSSLTYTKGWQTFTWDLTIEDFILGSKDGTEADYDSLSGKAFAIYVKGDFAVGDKIMVDDVVITRKPAPKVTVKTTDGGVVKRYFSNLATCSRECVDGEVFCGPVGKTRRFNITPGDGKVALVKYNGKTQIIRTSTNVDVLLSDADEILDVKFISADAKPEIVKTEIKSSSYNGSPAVYVYSLISDFVPGEVAPGYGIKLWKTDDSENYVTLDAYAAGSTAENKTLAGAEPGQAFVIKAYGNAIKVGESYTAEAFVGTTVGEAKTLTLE